MKQSSTGDLVAIGREILPTVSHNARMAALVIVLHAIFAGSVFALSSDRLIQLITVCSFVIIALLLFVIVIRDRQATIESDRVFEHAPASKLTELFYKTKNLNSEEASSHAAAARSIAEVLELDKVVEAGGRSMETGEFYVPCIDPVTLACRMLQVCSGELGRVAIRAAAVHSVPTGRSEAHWWSSPIARRYLDLQESLIRKGKLDVRRLIAVDDEESLYAEDVAPWYEQPTRGIKIRRCWRLPEELRQHKVSDCLILEIRSTSDVKAGCMFRIALLQIEANSDSSSIKVLASGSDDPRLEQITSGFDQVWEDSELLEIDAAAKEETESPWWDPEHEKRGTIGFVAYQNALRRVREAEQYVYASDVSDLKDGLSEVRRDPSYSAWYNTTNSLIGKREFARVFVLKRSPESVDEFIGNHVGEYFDDDGFPIQRCMVAVVFEDTILRRIEDTDEHEIEEWFKRHDAVRDHVSSLSDWSNSGWRDRWRSVLLRDFLITEQILYDYRTSRTAFDMRSLEPFLNEFHNLGDKQSSAQWKDLVEEIMKSSVTGVGAKRSELIGALRAGVKP